jgi:predicted metal-binding transcription factor (methanogenesis marker protein 9)
MSDDLSKKGNADRIRVAKGEEHEVKYLANKFGVSKEEVEKAIDRAGPMRENVEAELKKGGRGD